MFASVQEMAAFVASAAAGGEALRLFGGGSKGFYGNPAEGREFCAAGHAGIVQHVASELVLTARAGTPLAEVEAALRERGQMLAYDPPQFGGGGTFGGAIASGLAGPGKPRFGGARDAVLGIKMINGRGEALTFGGQVMKNVAGFDISRLMTGSLGTLGVITEASVRVLPRPASRRALALELPPAEALAALKDCAARQLPLAASFYCDGQLHVYLAGGNVDWAAQDICGGQWGARVAAQTADDECDDFWRSVRDHAHPFFARVRQSGAPLWRVSVPPAAGAAQAFAPRLQDGSAAFEWHGAVFWLAGGAVADVRRQAQELGGYACLFRRAAAGADSTGAAETAGDGADFLPQPSELHLRLHQRLKKVFDPAGIFNVGRLYKN